jgi:hypothetical protein
MKGVWILFLWSVMLLQTEISDLKTWTPTLYAINDDYEDICDKSLDTLPSIIQFDTDNLRRMPVKLRFRSGKVIDIRAENPYLGLPYPVIHMDEDSLEYLFELSDLGRVAQSMLLTGARLNEDALLFDLGGIQWLCEESGLGEKYSQLRSERALDLERVLSELYHFGKYEVYEHRVRENKLPIGFRDDAAFANAGFYLRAWVNVPRVEVQFDRAVVAYHITYYSNTEDILATQGYALIYDENGNEIQRLHDRKDGFYDIQLSNDGRYLMQQFGSNYGEDGGGQLNRGFRFYDVKSGELLLELELGKDQFITSYGSNNTHLNSGFHIVRRDSINYCWFYVFPKSKNIYQKKWAKTINLDDEMLQIYNDFRRNINLDFEQVIKKHGFEIIDQR